MRHVKLPLRHQSKRLVCVQTEENESRADRDVRHYFIVIRRRRRWRRVEERLRLVVVGCAEYRDGCGRRPDDWRATACIRARRRRKGCSDRWQRPEDACDVFDHLCDLCRLCVVYSLAALRACIGSTDGILSARHTPTTRLQDKLLHPRLSHAYRTLASVCFLCQACLLVSYRPLALHACAPLKRMSRTVRGPNTCDEDDALWLPDEHAGSRVAE